MARSSAATILDHTVPLIFAGMALGLAVGAQGSWIGVVAVGLLGALMTLALASFDLTGAAAQARRGLLALAASVGLLSPAFLVVGLLYPPESWGGWVLLAAAPPAISVIPYAAFLRGDLRLALTGTLLAYAAAFVYLPGVALVFLGTAVDLLPLVEATAFLLLVPLVLSRPLRRARVPDRSLARARNLLFFAVYALVTAAIREIVLRDPVGVAVVLAGTGLAVAGSYGLWSLLGLGLRIPAAARTTVDLFASFKNQTLASALALVLLGPVAALPPILAGVFEAVWLVVLVRVARRRDGTPMPR